MIVQAGLTPVLGTWIISIGTKSALIAALSIGMGSVKMLADLLSGDELFGGSTLG
jgi:hypothetical protein